MNRAHTLQVLERECNPHLKPLSFGGACFGFILGLHARLEGDVEGMVSGSRPMTVFLRFITTFWLSLSIDLSLQKRDLSFTVSKNYSHGPVKQHEHICLHKLFSMMFVHFLFLCWVGWCRRWMFCRLTQWIIQ